jgi:hypothetical protein
MLGGLLRAVGELLAGVAALVIALLRGVGRLVRRVL